MNKKITLTLLSAALAAGGYFAIQEAPNANDIVLSGTYGSLTVSKSGTVLDPVVIWGGDAQVQCLLVQADYIVIRDVTVKNCNTFGIRYNGNHAEIINNDVSDTVRMNVNGSSSSWHSAIRAADASDVLIKGNKVYQSWGEGISVLRADNVTVEDNIVFDTYSVNIYIDQCAFCVVRDNYSYSTDPAFYRAGRVARGISIGAESYSGWAFSVHDILIEGNTLERVRGINYIQEQAGTPYNVVVRDNVFINVPAPLVSLGSWATVSNNVTATPGGVVTAVISTPTPTRTPSRTPTKTATVQIATIPHTITATKTPAPAPTFCETAVSEHFIFLGCTR